MPRDRPEDASRINLPKIRGHAALLEEVLRGGPGHPLPGGLHDYVAVAAAETAGRCRDLPLAGGRDSALLRLLRGHG